MQESQATTKANQETAKRVLDEVNQGDFPAAMEHVSKLMAAAQSSNSSARDISKIVLKDLGLTNKVLKIANSAYYSMRSSGVRKISTITGAVVLLGLKTVRDIAASVSLFDYFCKKSGNMKELKRMVALSFTGAIFAREMSRAINFPDDEEAYLCGLFYDLGRMVGAFMLPAVYKKIQADMEKGISESQSAKNHLGMSFKELGISVAKTWNFSDRICKSMEPITAKKDGPADNVDILRAMASIGHLISHAACSGKNTDEEISRIVALYGKIIPINQDMLTDAREEAERRAVELMAPLGIDEAVWKNGEVLSPKEAAEPAMDPAEQNAAELEKRKEAILNASVEITESIVKGCDLDSIFMIIMESMEHGLGFSHVLFALINPNRTIIKARYGIGPDIETHLAKISLPINDTSGIIASSVAWSKDMTVMKDDPKLPEGDKLILNCFASSAIGALPIIVDDKSIGSFVVAMQNGTLDAASMRQAGRLRDYAVLAIESIRNRRKK